MDERTEATPREHHSRVMYTWRCSRTDESEVLLQQGPVSVDPGRGELAVLRLAGQEVEEVHPQTSQHQHLQVEAVPVRPQVDRNLDNHWK